MTYYDIIEEFYRAASSHFMIAEVGYGPISDIKSRSQNAGSFHDGEQDNTDYPYMFINPGVHSRGAGVMTYQFNLIMMDMAWEETPNADQPTALDVIRFTNEAQIQSQCQQYIDDVIAQLWNTGRKTQNFDMRLDVTYTPFVERFQDSVAGMTANVKIEVPTPINWCDAPYQIS
jgi:hypothetical protein